MKKNGISGYYRLTPFVTTREQLGNSKHTGSQKVYVFPANMHLALCLSPTNATNGTFCKAVGI
jgi:hypothetical protein